MSQKEISSVQREWPSVNTATARPISIQEKTMKKLLTILAVLLMASPAAAQLIITGLVDGPLPGGLPKVVEVYACTDIADLSMFAIGSANNGGGTDGPEWTFPADAVSAGTTLMCAASTPEEFAAFFGFEADYVAEGYALSINGDDAVELFEISGIEPVVIDTFGEIDVDGTGQPWEHLDGWAKRNTLTGPDGSIFILDSWSFSGPNALDGELTNADAVTPYPLGGYECDPTVATDAQTFDSLKSLYR